MKFPDLENLVKDAGDLAKQMRTDYRTGVRRLLGTAEWQHDPERLASAEGKRERRRARNRRTI